MQSSCRQLLWQETQAATFLHAWSGTFVKNWSSTGISFAWVPCLVCPWWLCYRYRVIYIYIIRYQKYIILWRDLRHAGIYDFAWLTRNHCERLQCPWLTNHMHIGYRGKMEKMHCVAARWLATSLTDCWNCWAELPIWKTFGPMMQPKWYSGSRLLHMFGSYSSSQEICPWRRFLHGFC